MAMFTNNTCCPCGIPLWVGAFIIGFMEFMAGDTLMSMGFSNAGMLLMNSIWFMFLFIPALFYSPQYRKAVLIIYSITTIFSIIGMIVGTIGLAMIMSDEENFDKLVAEMEIYSGGITGGAWVGGMMSSIGGMTGEMGMSGGMGGMDMGGDMGMGGMDMGMGGGMDMGMGGLDMTGGMGGMDMTGGMGGMDMTGGASMGTAAPMQPGPMAGDKVAYAHVIAYSLRADMIYNMDQPEDVTDAEWKRQRYMGAMIGFQIEMWINFVFIRCFYNMVLMKFQKEAEWLKQATGDETAASHPCRPLCCNGGNGTK